MYRINDTIRYVSSIHWSDTWYVSRYVSYHLLNTNIAETVIKLKSHMFHANIEAGIGHVCNIWLATGIFRNSPWHLGRDNLLTILFIADNFTCTIETYMAVTIWSQRTGLKLWPYHLWLSLWSNFKLCMYVQCTSTSQCYKKWRASELNLCLKNTHY